jgi:DNA polymerase-3 subunit epsilon
VDPVLTLSTLPTQRDQARYVVVDVETTGLSPVANRVVSIAMVFCDGDGEVLETWYSLVDAGVDTGPVAIHGITTDMLIGQPTFAQLADDINKAMDGLIFVAHNAAFDWRFLSREFERAGTSIVSVDRVCTLVAARKQKLDVSSYSLGSLGEFFGLPAWRAHDALDDAVACAGLLRSLLARQR